MNDPYGLRGQSKLQRLDVAIAMCSNENDGVSHGECLKGKWGSQEEEFRECNGESHRASELLAFHVLPYSASFL